MNTTEEDVAVKGKTKRILAFDLIRGYFLLVIMIDHIELYPNGWDFVTGKGRLWVSAAEGFFFLSGLLIGMIYKRRLALGMKFIFKKMWRRAAELYVVGTSLTFIYLSWAVFTNHPAVKDSLPIPFDWHHYIFEALVMRFTYGWADFLIRFAILMVFAPIVFYLVAKKKWWLALAGIITAWALRGQGFTLAWQLIFNTGIIIGFYWEEIIKRFRKLHLNRRRQIKRTFGVLAVLSFAASYGSVYLLSLLYYLWGVGMLSEWWQHIAYTWGRLNYDAWVYADKWTMGPLRIALFFTWFPVLYWIVHRYEVKIGKFTKGILELLGRNSLFVYTLESLIVFAFRLYLRPSQNTFFLNFLITSLSLIVLVSLTYGFKKIEPKLPLLWQKANTKK